MVTRDAPTLWDDEEPTWSVPELGEALGMALRRSFPDEAWVRGEIRNLSRGRSNMVWFDLVEPAPGDDHSRAPLAKLPVVLFGTARDRVNNRLRGAGAAVRMADGTEVRIRARVGFWAPGGRLQLQMSDIDPAFTLGRLAADRERLLRLLDAEGLLGRQAGLARPAVPLRVGLVTSGGSAAEHDVLDELRRSGLGFRVVRADARVQGPAAPRSVVRALRVVAARGVDVVLLVRGGGATTDLAAFDSEVIARAVAGLDVVVLTGIGHDVDRSVADEVAHAAYKTPTACAQAVVDDVRAFDARLRARWGEVAVIARRQLRRESDRLRTCGRHVAVGTRHGLVAADRSLAHTGERLRRSSATALARSGATLERATGRVQAGARAHLRAHDQALDTVFERLAGRGPRAVAGATRELDRIAGQVRALDPARTLGRGWSITRSADGTLVRSPADVRPGDVLRTTVAGGKVDSTVTGAPTDAAGDVDSTVTGAPTEEER
ncbi:MAG TPA: exodeoxyribonuclease VII large subunit [Acidimicrobiales bacterium]|nr:exodeoxyribonuclease VII large subunit [Acidimicrobiales bacterium]